jgi:hypothetical protein
VLLLATRRLPSIAVHNEHRNATDGKPRAGCVCVQVFERLDRLRDLCCAGLVCRSWYAASTHEEFWRRLAFDPSRSIPAAQVVALCRKHTGVKHLNLRGVSNADEVLTHIAGTELHALCSLTLAYQVSPSRLASLRAHHDGWDVSHSLRPRLPR